MLDGGAFDDGSLECLNFSVATQEEAVAVSLEWLRSKFGKTHFDQAVEARRRAGESWMSVRDLTVDWDGDLILEVHWG
jgi:hypothetical protein